MIITIKKEKKGIRSKFVSNKWETVRELCVPSPRPLLRVVQVDIPEEQGNVVVLYEVC